MDGALRCKGESTRGEAGKADVWFRNTNLNFIAMKSTLLLLFVSVFFILIGNAASK